MEHGVEVITCWSSKTTNHSYELWSMEHGGDYLLVVKDNQPTTLTSHSYEPLLRATLILREYERTYTQCLKPLIYST